MSLPAARNSLKKDFDEVKESFDERFKRKPLYKNKSGGGLLINKALFAQLREAGPGLFNAVNRGKKRVSVNQKKFDVPLEWGDF